MPLLKKPTMEGVPAIPVTADRGWLMLLRTVTGEKARLCIVRGAQCQQLSESIGRGIDGVDRRRAVSDLEQGQQVVGGAAGGSRQRRVGTDGRDSCERVSDLERRANESDDTVVGRR